VAGEVRALAQKSANAAKDIRVLIDDSVHRIKVGTELADKSGTMLTGINQSISNVSSMIKEIAQASKEQSVGIAEVHRAIASIDQVTQENTALVEETSAAAEQLSKEATELLTNVRFFKLT
jgi:methyl-accepting chemotaxis protein